jgi:hypothetical protein
VREDLPGEWSLLGGIVAQAITDASQTARPHLAEEALHFLDICAPIVAEGLRTGVIGTGVGVRRKRERQSAPSPWFDELDDDG